MASMSRQVTYDGDLHIEFVGIMGMDLIYISTHTGREGKRAHTPKEIRV